MIIRRRATSRSTRAGSPAAMAAILLCRLGRAWRGMTVSPAFRATAIRSPAAPTRSGSPSILSRWKIRVPARPRNCNPVTARPAGYAAIDRRIRKPVRTGILVGRRLRRVDVDRHFRRGRSAGLPASAEVCRRSSFQACRLQASAGLSISSSAIPEIRPIRPPSPRPQRSGRRSSSEIFRTSTPANMGSSTIF